MNVVKAEKGTRVCLYGVGLLSLSPCLCSLIKTDMSSLRRLSPRDPEFDEFPR